MPLLDLLVPTSLCSIAANFNYNFAQPSVRVSMIAPAGKPRSSAWPASWLVLVVVAALLDTGCGWRRPRAEVGPDGVEHRLEYAGLDRHYVSFVPQGASDGLPLVIVLHGGGGRADKTQNFTGFNRLAAEHGFIAAYPAGIEHNWNDGRDRPGSYAHENRLDDVGFIVQVVEDLAQRHSIDRNRVFVTGVSNGAFMSARLVCERADVFRAAAPVIGGIAANIAPACRPSQPTAILVLKGTDDPLVPYKGGDVRFGKRKLGKMWSTDDELALWRGANGCSDDPSTQRRVDDVPDDETAVVIREWRTGCEHSPVIEYRIAGGGHTWPGGAQYAPERFIGRTTREIQAETIIWSFFASLRPRTAR